MRALVLLLLLTPLCVGWNGSGPAVTDISIGRHVVSEQFRTEAVCAGHDDRIEIIVVVPLTADGDGVLSLRFDRDFINRDIDMPSLRVRARYREYAGDGSTLFAGATVSTGFARLAGDPRGALTMSFDAIFTDGVKTRHVVSDARLIALDWEPDAASNGGTSDEPDGYYEGGCSGNYYESDYEDDGYNESYDDDGGCGGDDLDDDEPSDDSGSGCAGDDDDYSTDSDASGDTGCGGDDYDSDDDYDDDDDSSGCAGDDLDDAIVAFVRSGGNGPWLGRMVRWLPWMCVFFAIRLMRRRRPRGYAAAAARVS